MYLNFKTVAVLLILKAGYDDQQFMKESEIPTHTCKDLNEIYEP